MRGLKQRRPEAWDVEIGRRMRARRLELRMSQEELGKAVGVTFQQIQKYEKGANRVGGGRLQRVCEALQVPVTYFYDPQPGESAAPAARGETPKLFAFLQRGDAVKLLGSFSLIRDRTIRRALVQIADRVAQMSKPRRA
jgi:transcriptional regulator with XRE-family HTH domain